MDITMSVEDLYNPGIATGSSLISYMNSMLTKHRSECTYMKFCEYICDVLHNWDKMFYKVGNKLGLSLDNHDFIEIMKRYDEAREIITVQGIKDDLTPLCSA